MTTVGYQIPNYTHPTVSTAELFGHISASAQAAEAAGADTIFVMDHFYQLPMLGPPEDAMLECYSVLNALAPVTSTARLASLVTGNTYRNPAMLAKTITALDVISGGRALLGIGAGWFEAEHDAYGYEFGSFTTRFEKLEEALQIIIPMLAGERPSLAGRHYTVRDAINEPQPIQDKLPVMIGGAGEKKTLRMVAQYADESNLICGPNEIPHKMDVLASHCETFDRDPSEIAVSWLGSFVVAPTTAEAETARNAFLRDRGVDYDSMPDEAKAQQDARMKVGDPDTISAWVQEELVDRGLPGLTFNLPATWHDPDLVSVATEAIRSVYTRG